MFIFTTICEEINLIFWYFSLNVKGYKIISRKQAWVFEIHIPPFAMWKGPLLCCKSSFLNSIWENFCQLYVYIIPWCKLLYILRIAILLMSRKVTEVISPKIEEAVAEVEELSDDYYKKEISIEAGAIYIVYLVQVIDGLLIGLFCMLRLQSKAWIISPIKLIQIAAPYIC